MTTTYVKSQPKVQQPRKLEETETVQKLNAWKLQFRNFYRSCDVMAIFLDPATKGDPTKDNYGFEEEASGAKRSAAVLKEDLLGFFATVAGFMPNDYVHDKLVSETTCVEDVWTIVYEIFDADIHPGKFLGFAKLTKDPAETYRNFWNRLVGFVRQHAAQNPRGEPAITAEGATVPAEGDTLTVTLLDLITVHWLTSIDRRLLTIVQTEFATQLKTKRLCQLIKLIATNIDDLLKRYESRDSVSTIRPATKPLATRVIKPESDEEGYSEVDVIRRIRKLEKRDREWRKKSSRRPER